MRIGISSWTFPWAIGTTEAGEAASQLTPLGLLESAEALGAQVVQIADNLSLQNREDAELNRLARFARSHGITIELGMKGLDGDDVARMLAIAEKLDCTLLRTLLPADVGSPAEAIARLEVLLPRIEAAGVCLAIENHERFNSSEYADIARHFVGRNFGICLDTANNVATLERPGEVVSRLLDYTVNLHMKDFQIQRLPNRLGFVTTGACTGEGEVDVDELISRLRAMGSDISVILEQWPPERETVEETIAIEKDWASRGIRYLHSIVNNGGGSNGGKQ